MKKGLLNLAKGMTVITAFQHLLNKHIWRICERAQTNIILSEHKSTGRCYGFGGNSSQKPQY